MEISRPDPLEKYNNMAKFTDPKPYLQLVEEILYWVNEPVEEFKVIYSLTRSLAHSLTHSLIYLLM